MPRMQDLDPATLLFIPRDEYEPLQLDPELFESVGDGVSLRAFVIPKPASQPPPPPRSPTTPSAVYDPLDRLKSLAAKLNPPSTDGPDSSSLGGINQHDASSSKGRMGTAEAWDAAWERDLDQRVLEIDRPNIFDSFHTPENSHVFDIPDSKSLASSSSSTVSADLGSKAPEAVDPYTEWNRRTVFGSLAHPAGAGAGAGPTSSHSNIKDSADISFDLPVLTKRPRDILDECLQQDQSSVPATSNKHQQSVRDVRAGKVAKIQVSKNKFDQRESRAETWRAAGKPVQDDLTGAQEGSGTGNTLLQEQLSWEACSKTGPRTISSHLVMSPYVTEAETATFESVYQRHMDYAFKFRPAPTLVPYKKLIECIFLLLGGTSSSIFTYNSAGRRFEMDSESIRIEGCSTTSMSRLLDGMLSAGTHMRRLVAVADTCINHPEQTHLLELHHKTLDLEQVLSRLARLCQCHISQENEQAAGFYLPPGPDLLSMIYSEILEQPSPSDALWVALLLSILDQASKPYRDILSRWMGITPSAHGGHDRNQLSNLAAARRLSSGPGLSGFSGCPTTNNKSGSTGSAGGLFSIFDSHLQQSLQGLDPFEEFFVQSKHGWSWDGSELIVLADPLDYSGEFKMSDTVSPARFLGDRLAERVMEAGKELQILIEFEPRHPLIAHDRNCPMSTNWLKWFYIQDDVDKHRKECAKARAEVLYAVGTRLESMGCISKATYRNRTEKQAARGDIQEGSIEDSQGMMELDLHPFVQLPGQGAGMESEAISLDLGLNPDLLGFFSLSSTLGQTKEMTLACPDMMAFLLGPTPSKTSKGLSPSGEGAGQNQIRLEGLAPLTVLAEQSLCYSVRARTSLINTCVMSLYFHDLNLLGHLEIMERFLLMRDGQFVARLGEALFEDETGLLTRCADAANEAANETADASAGTGSDRHGSVASTTSSGSTWRKARLTWPPRSGEVEMTLRAVLLDCFQAGESGNLEGSDEVKESDVSDMEIEGDGSAEAARAVERESQEHRPLRRRIAAHELEDTLSFSVKGYEDESTICRDANALEALDFLYLDYKAPRPLRLLVFTASAFAKYTRLFTFQLRLARVGAAMKQVYRHLRTRQKAVSGMAALRPDVSPKVLQVQEQLWIEMRMLHRFRFEAQQIFDGLQGYIVSVAMGQTWEAFMERLREVQSRVEARIMASTGEITVEEEEKSGVDDLGDLVALRDEHDQVLDQMLLLSLLKRKQAPILKIVHGILNCLLRLFQMVKRLPEPTAAVDLGSLESEEGGGEGLLDEMLERQRVRIEKLQSLQDKFRVLCRMLVKVLKVLDERGVGIEAGTSSASARNRQQSESSSNTANAGGNSTSGEFLPQLLLRLDMSGFNNN
ncbi:hypothetical protein BGX29_009874 [Mortierella sp. GBA35]|nr:hypothetical protein BGX29_009874 [Mortierella sp. GBA35]